MAAGAVMVTGASSGIGEACTLHLALRGFQVFAGIRKPADGERLESQGGGAVRALQVDVTDRDSIASAARELSEATGDAGLAGLVNNAGIAVSGPLEFLSLDELRRQLEVNVVGQVAVIQELLPMLRRARGRVLNMGSIGGRVALPLLGAYAASKFALEGLTDSLRREVRHFGIEVSIIEPGGVATPIWDKSGAEADRLIEAMPPEADALYGDMIRAMRAEARAANERGLPPVEVARVVERALTTKRPRTRYLVGRDAKMRAAIARAVPDRTFDSLVARTLSGSKADG